MAKTEPAGSCLLSGERGVESVVYYYWISWTDITALPVIQVRNGHA